MDFEFTDEQRMLRDSVKKFVADQYSMDQRRALMESDLGYSEEHYATFAELGWTAIPFSEDDGGLGGSAVDVMIVLEEMGRGLVLEPYFPSVVLSDALLRQASADVRSQIVSDLISGEKKCALALAEPQSRFNLADVRTRGEKSGSGYALTGRKQAVLAGATADWLIVPARTSGEARDATGVTVFVVDAKAKGVDVRATKLVDGLRGADVTFKDAPAELIVGDVDAGLPVVERAVDRAMIALGGEALGLLDVLVRSTVEYTKERVQFGQPISKFQALQHRMVDMFIEAESARSMVYMATMVLDRGGDDVAKAAAQMKVQVGRSGRFVGQQAIQLHGGMGMTDEMAVSHYFKRMTMLDLTFGNADHHLRRFVEMS